MLILKFPITSDGIVKIPRRPNLNLTADFFEDPNTGPHASIPVVPTATNMIHHNLRSANPPPGAIHQYPGTNRDKNNYVPMPGVYWYADTHPTNVGPHAIKITDSSNMV